MAERRASAEWSFSITRPCGKQPTKVAGRGILLVVSALLRYQTLAHSVDDKLDFAGEIAFVARRFLRSCSQTQDSFFPCRNRTIDLGFFTALTDHYAEVCEPRFVEYTDFCGRD